MVAVPAAAQPPASNLPTQDDDWVADFASSLDTRVPRGASPFSAEDAPTKPNRRWFSWLFWKFPTIGSKFTWNEPMWFRLRLRGDIPRRAIVVVATWAGGTGLLLILFAINVKPPSILLAPALGTIFGGIAGLFLFGRRDHVSGHMSLKKDAIHRHRNYVSSDLAGGWNEWTRWPYPGIDRCVIIPAEATGKSFSVLILVFGATREIIGVPRRDVIELQQHLRAEGVPVEQGRSVPNEYRQPLNVKFPVVVGAICTTCFLFGLGFYAFRMAGHRASQADANAAREQLREIRENARRDAEQFRAATQFHRSGPDPAAPPTGPGAGIAAFPGRAPLSEPDAGQGNPAPTFGSGGRMRPGAGGPFGGVGPGGPGRGMIPHSRPQPGGIGFEQRLPGNEMTMPDSTTGQIPEQRQPGDTELAGGTGGVPFRAIGAGGKPVVGFRYATGNWLGTPALRQLEPLYDREAPGGNRQTILARDGYAVGAVHVEAGQLVQAVRVVFMRVLPDGQLDTTDTYSSDWIGEVTGQGVKQLGGTGAPVLGVYGRRAAVLDAFGLVMAPTDDWD